MYNPRNDTPRPAHSNGSYYRDINNILYKRLVKGFHVDTGEQFVVLRQVEDGKVWIVPATQMYETILIDGTPTKLYTPEYNYQEEVQRAYENSRARQAERYGESRSSYPGYTDDPRLGDRQRSDSRDYRQDREDWRR